MEQRFTTAAAAEARNSGSAAAVTRAIPITFTSSTRAHSASSLSSTVPTALIPALLTRMSSPPSWSLMVWMAAAIVSRLVTSQTIPSIPSGSSFGAMSSTATRAPRSARSFAVARPMPDAPPVTAATRPVNSAISDSLRVYEFLAGTGGASGIGLATAKLLAERGARVAVLDIAPNELPDGIDGIVCDVTSRETIAAAIQTIRDQLGGLDILVNNAGISAVGTVEDNDDAEWARVLDVNVIGMARVTAAALPLLRASDAAAVVNLCSIAALNGLPQRAVYGASKGAVLALTFAMATDHVRAGIRVNCVSPGTVDTPFVNRMLQLSLIH